MNEKLKFEGNYRYVGSGRWENDYLVNPLVEIIDALKLSDNRLFEVGFGNGWTAKYLSEKGYVICGVDPSDSGVEIAQQAYPELNLQFGSVYDDLPEQFGTFPVVYSLEVIEHVQFPRKFAQTVFDLLDPDGVAIISTPYHGYIKNLVIAILGKTDSHYNPLWDDGHIRFFSEKTMTDLLLEVGFKTITFKKTGRIGPICKSMIAIASK